MSFRVGPSGAGSGVRVRFRVRFRVRVTVGVRVRVRVGVGVRVRVRVRVTCINPVAIRTGRWWAFCVGGSCEGHWLRVRERYNRARYWVRIRVRVRVRVTVGVRVRVTCINPVGINPLDSGGFRRALHRPVEPPPQ